MRINIYALMFSKANRDNWKVNQLFPFEISKIGNERN